MADHSDPAVALPPGTILAVSGSLRRASINSAVLRAAVLAAARDGIRVTLASIRDLPPFDPDLEWAPPESVLRFRTACEDAVGVLLAVPEYTFGVPGAFKNALDWTVGSGSLYRKQTTVLKVAPPGRGGNLDDTLGLALRAHGADVVRRALPVSARQLDAHGEVTDARILEQLRSVVAELARRADPAQSLLSTGTRSRAGTPEQETAAGKPPAVGQPRLRRG